MSGRLVVQEVIAEDLELQRLVGEVEARMDEDPGHDLHHALRVAEWTLRIGGDRIVARDAIAAALLHDIVNLPKESPERARASELSAEVARELLPSHGFTPAAIDEIADAIRDHSYSRGAVPASVLGKALQDADRLEALGSLGILRTLAAGVRMGAAFFDADDPFASERPLDDRRYTIDHFFAKLLELPDRMLTEAGRREAQARVAGMERFLEQLGREIGHDYRGQGATDG